MPHHLGLGLPPRPGPLVAAHLNDPVALTESIGNDLDFDLKRLRSVLEVDEDVTPKYLETI